MTRPKADSRAVEVHTDPPVPDRHSDPAEEQEHPAPVSGFALPGISVRPAEAIMVGSADAAEERTADAVARRVVATLRARPAPPDAIGTTEAMLTADATVTADAGRPALAALRRQAANAPTPIGRSGGPVTASLASRLRRAQRSAGEPLAPPARNAFESALGTDLGSVRLHAGADAAALSGEVGARAFTIGRDIFFSAGAPDLGTEDGQHLLAHELAHATAPAAAAVRREVVTQLMTEPRADNQIIVTEVRFAGRPENTYTGSMGDHTTAFTVHVKGIRLALEGQPLSIAIAEMQRLATNLLSLPGAQDEYVAGLGPRQAKLFRAAQARLLSAGKLLASGSADVGALQDYIGAYLGLREVVPFSTINTRWVTAKGGKGKGEKVEALASRAAGLATPAQDVYDEVIGTFDVAAVARVCAETDPATLAALSPGLPAKLSVDERAALFVEQHVLSVEANFPGTLAALAELPAFGQPSASSTAMDVRPDDTSAQPDSTSAQPKLDQPEVEQPKVEQPPKVDLAAVRRLLMAALQGRVTIQAKTLQRDALNYLLHDLAAVQKRLVERGVSEDLKDKIAAFELREQEEALLRRVNSLEAMLGDQLSQPCVLPELGLQRGDRRRGKSTGSAPVQNAEQPRGKKRRNSSAKKSEETVAEEAKPIVLPDPAPAANPDADSVMVLDDAVGPTTVAAEVEEEAEDQGPLTIQVQLAADGTVAGFRAGGRTDSPFSGTMGAHTTAWIVHLDRVRALIRGKSVEQALGLVIDELGEERSEIERLLGPAFWFGDGEDDYAEEGQLPDDFGGAPTPAPFGPDAVEEDEFGSPAMAIPVPIKLDTTPGLGPDPDEESEFGSKAADSDEDFYSILPYEAAKLAEPPGMELDDTEASLSPAPVEPVVEKPDERVRKSIGQTGNALVALQKAIGVHLRALNFIPGVTLPAARTGGDAEGGPRGVLLEHIGQERFAERQRSRTAEELASAIHGLLDISSLLEDGQGDNSLHVEEAAQPQQRLAHLHLALIKRAYGDVLSGDFPTAEAYVAALIEAVTQRLDSDADSDDAQDSESEDSEDRGSKRRKLLTGKGKKTAKANPKGKKEAPTKDDDKDLDHIDDPVAAEILADLTARWDQALLDLLAGKGDSTGSGPGSTGARPGRRPTGEVPVGVGLGAPGGLGGLGGLAAPNNAAWFDQNGDLLPDRLNELCEAYRADSGEAGIYLGQTEGQLVARLFGVTVDVYKDNPPVGYTVIWNPGGGDCLIHALADIRDALHLEQVEGKSASEIVAAFPAEQPRPGREATLAGVRTALGTRPVDEMMKSAVVDIVRNQIEGRPNPGLGKRMLQLLFGGPLFQAIIQQRRWLLAVSRAMTAGDADGGKKGSSAPSSAPVQPRRQDIFGVLEAALPDVVMQPEAVVQPDVVQPAPRQDVPALQPPDQQEIGRGASLPNYALLHSANHYVALIKTS